MPNAAQRRFLHALSELAYCNPFLPDRMTLEQEALGDDYVASDALAWSRTAETEQMERPNVTRLTERAFELASHMRSVLAAAEQADAATETLYTDLVSYVLYYRHFVSQKTFNELSTSAWRPFHGDWQHFFAVTQQSLPASRSPEHLFACLFQVRRAFRNIFDCILGESEPAARLRAQVWQSIFTHDMRRYRQSLYDRMADFPTLVTGPSGTGKELVARAIALSQYIHVDKNGNLAGDNSNDDFVALNLSALSPTLIESELFGHRKGAFTGATVDRAGWLESCPEHGAVFLDEIGELDTAIQVKLLRVVQHRSYTRLGETRERSFAGKVIAATNRDLAEEIHAGRFREDLYYRLCADRVVTPTLREQLSDRPGALPGLVHFIAQRVAGSAADDLAAEAIEWIAANLPTDYAWPGNIRELEQCVRNVLIRRDYIPRPTAQAIELGPRAERWLDKARAGALSADELLSSYCTWVYAQHGTYEKASQQLKLDRRTVRSKIDEALLAAIQAANNG